MCVCDNEMFCVKQLSQY